MKKDISQIIIEHQALIYKIASKYSTYYSVEDLFQVGVIGLIKAYKKFKPSLGVKFSTYAYKYIFGEIINFIKQDRSIKLSINSLKIYKEYEKVKELLSQKYGKVPSFEDICEFMEMNNEDVLNAITESEFVLSLDDNIKEDEPMTFIDLCKEDKRNSIDELLDIKKELESLSSKERKIIELHYFKDYTQNEIAKYLNMTQVQVSRCEKHVLEKMRKNIAC